MANKIETFLKYPSLYVYKVDEEAACLISFDFALLCINVVQKNTMEKELRAYILLAITISILFL